MLAPPATCESATRASGHQRVRASSATDEIRELRQVEGISVFAPRRERQPRIMSIRPPVCLHPLCGLVDEIEYPRCRPAEISDLLPVLDNLVAVVELVFP